MVKTIFRQIGCSPLWKLRETKIYVTHLSTHALQRISYDNLKICRKVADIHKPSLPTLNTGHCSFSILFGVLTVN